MAQQSYRANLTAAEFPFLSEFQGRTIILPQIDQNYSRQSNSPKNKDRDIGIPQAYYMHNVVPTDAGLTSVAYQAVANPPFGGSPVLFDSAYNIRDTDGNATIFGYGSRVPVGNNFVLKSLGIGWTITDGTKAAAGRFVTTAHVNGQTYIFFGGVGCTRYDYDLQLLVNVPLAGLTVANILGICASNGYMIAWDEENIYWSSLIDPTDFVPSLVTGAGSQGVQLAKAEIVVCLPLNTGFVVYTKRNAVAQIFSGNSLYPFNAKEIIGAGGVSNPALVAFDGNSTNHYAYTTAGLQEISQSSSQVAFPQLTDFIAGAQFEDYDETINQFSTITLVAPMVKKLTMVGNRYFVFSYGVTQLTHALVYDFALARWGKLKITHVDCFEYFYPSSDVVEAPKRNIGFLQADGTIQVAVVSYSTTGSYGTVLLGKYQLDRNRMLEMQEIHVESVQDDALLNIKLLSAIDGLNTTTTVPTPADNVGTYRRYNCRASALNHSIAISGAFNLSSLVLKFTDAGEVR